MLTTEDKRADSDIAATGPSTRASSRRVIRNHRLQRSQHIHSAVVTGLGLLGTIGCVVVAVFVRPVSGLEIGVFVAMFLLVGTGLTVGYHRYFTHRSFKATPGLRRTLAILGCMGGQGPVVFWVALHRFHHEFSDREGDPHSPNLFGSSPWQKARGLFHAYIGWTVKHEVPNVSFYAKDLLTDRAIMRINHFYFGWVALGWLLPALVVGIVTRSWTGALVGFLWGGLARMFALHNIIWWITSFAHVFGTRDLNSRDLSTNNLWLAVPTLGESWHNNHHCFPTAAILRFKWYQIDISGALIRLLEVAGLAWDVQRPKADAISAMRRV